MVLLLVVAAGGLRAQTTPIVTLGASTTSGGGCALVGGATCTLTARATGLTPADVTFQFSPRVAGDSVGPKVGPNSGLTTITYTAPNPVLSRQTITVTATGSDGITKAQTTITLVPASITVSVTPSSTVTLTAGATQHFTATVFGVSNTAVTWSISPQVGTLVANGNSADYTAPNPIPSTQKITITATSDYDNAVSGAGSVQLNAASLTISPSSTVTLTGGAMQVFTATLAGTTQTTVNWSMSPQVGTLAPTSGLTTTYTAPPSVAASQKITITATTPDGSLTTSVGVQLSVASVTITPSTATITTSQTQQFTAVVSNAATNNVTWSITPQTGSIDQNGLYTPPANLTVSTKITVTATSTADPTRSGTATITVNPVIGVGSGAPTQTMIFVFQNAFMRSGLGNYITMPPAGNVKPFGPTGYVQEFTDAENSTLKDALVTGASSVGGVNTAFAIFAPLYAYYSTVSANSAGYPLADSQACSAQGVTCQWDTFDKNYVLFSYASKLPNEFGPNFALSGATYTEWTTHGGGMSGLGAPVTTASSVTSSVVVAPATTGANASAQGFVNGAIYSITSGANRGQVFTVLGPLYNLYTTQNGPAGQLGLPTSEMYQIGANVYKQNFEAGALQYTVGSDPGVLLPVASVRIDGAQGGSTVALALGQSITLTATPVLTSGDTATDRPVSWTTTNGKAVSIQATGGTAVVTAIGAGAASVQAASQGVSSARVNFIVTSPCCAIGDGAPASVQQAFRDALTRNKLTVQAPVPSPAARVGGGYVQMAPAADSNAVYLLAQSDRLGTAYVVSGAILAQYQALGGAAGQLGYPASDASAGGTQLFANGALGGTPVRLVRGPVLTKWAQLGYETGAAGLPTGDAADFSTLGANDGEQQSFSNGMIVGAVTGPRAGQAYFVSGAILAKYRDLGGPSGDYGMPASDEFSNGGVRQQNFEGGTITWAGGGVAAVEHPAARVPGVIAFPPVLTAGARAHLAVLGFADNSMVRVSVTGSPDFMVTTAKGSYSWEMAIPLTAKSGAIAIHAADGKGATADGTLTIRGFADNRVKMSIAAGNNQTGLPGSLLPQRLRVALADASNAPVVGATVAFTATPGAQLSAAAALTDADGLAEVAVRLPAAEGLVGVTASAAGIAQSPVTFYVRAAGSTLTNVPAMTAGDALLGKGPATIGQKGALVTAVAMILRYHQNRGELKAPNGSADAAALNQFLTQYCTVDAKGAPVCDGYVSSGSGAEQVVNLWRAAEFTGGVDVAAQSPTVQAVSDVLAQGSPALLSLAISRNGAAAGGHFVVATGVAADGSIAIQDPSAFFGRTSLADYLRGFNSAGVTWTGELRGVVQFALRNPSPTRFLVGAVSQSANVMKTLALDVRSPDGVCGAPVDLVDAVDSAGNPSGNLVSRFVACDGGSAAYQLSIGAGQPYQAFVTDLATAGSTMDLSGAAPAAYRATREKLNLALAPLTASFTADAVVNAATFAPGAAPGGIVSIFGSGLAGAGSATTVEFDGVAATVLLASPFQVNAVVPAEMAPGAHQVRVRSAFGTVEQTVTVSAVAPGIFTMGSADAGAVLNYPDYSLNSASSPVMRGQYLSIYTTGLGAVTRQGSLSVVTNPATVVLGGKELPALFAGLAPGFTGLYQLNVVIPSAMPPGLDVPLYIKQGGQVSNRVLISIQ